MLKFIKLRQYIPILIVIVIAFTLRTYNVDKLPPGLYDDEVSLGYNAYSLLTYGKDEYGEKFPLWFKAFGEYKLPVYVYADIIPIAIFGKNELAVRLPSVLFGTLTILFLYLFLQDLLSLEPKILKNKFNNIPLISSFILAITPWHIHFSRGAYESVVAVCLYMIASWQFIVFYKKKKIPYLILSLSFFILASYTYNYFRILTPLTLALMFYFMVKTKYVAKKTILFIAFYVALLHIPLLSFTLSSHGYTRFLQTSTFTKQSLPPVPSPTPYPPSVSLPTSTPLQFFAPDFVAYPFIFIKNYLSYFSLEELFIKAQDNVRFYSSSEFGFLFRWQLPFFFLGFLILLKERSEILKKTILGMFFIIPAIAAITISPNALRALLLTIPISIITSIGMQSIIKYKILFAKIVFTGIILLGIYETALYFHMYTSHYQNSHIVFWGGAQKKIVEEATSYSKDYYAIVINEDLLPNEKVHFLFYNDKLKPLFVNGGWHKPKEWENKRILYIRYPLKESSNPKIKILKNITLDTISKDAVAQFLEL